MFKYILGCICITFICIVAKQYTAISSVEKSNLKYTNKAPINISNRLMQHSLLAKNYAVAHHLNNTVGFLIDMKIPSGNYRFFVINFQTDSIIAKGMVTHGSGSYINNDSLQFSNVAKSGCTSLGMYSIGKSYQGTFGLAYKLHGLNTSNNNAFKRFVVLHAHNCVPLIEVAPHQLCQSLGCPTVAPLFLTQLQYIIDNAVQPIMLYIYY